MARINASAAVISGSFLSGKFYTLPMLTAIGAATELYCAGAMMSLCFIMVPVLLDLATDATALVSQWRRMYGYGHKTMPFLAIGTFTLYAFTCIQRHRAKKGWGIFVLAAVTTLTMIPFTWICMAGTNNELFKLEDQSKIHPLDIDVVEIKQLVLTWKWLHFTRCLFPLLGAVIGTLGQE